MRHRRRVSAHRVTDRAPMNEPAHPGAPRSAPEPIARAARTSRSRSQTRTPPPVSRPRGGAQPGRFPDRAQTSAAGLRTHRSGPRTMLQAAPPSWARQDTEPVATARYYGKWRDGSTIECPAMTAQTLPGRTGTAPSCAAQPAASTAMSCAPEALPGRPRTHGVLTQHAAPGRSRRNPERTLRRRR